MVANRTAVDGFDHDLRTVVGSKHRGRPVRLELAFMELRPFTFRLGWPLSSPFHFGESESFVHNHKKRDAAILSRVSPLTTVPPTEQVPAPPPTPAIQIPPRKLQAEAPMPRRQVFCTPFLQSSYAFWQLAMSCSYWFSH